MLRDGEPDQHDEQRTRAGGQAKSPATMSASLPVQRGAGASAATGRSIRLGAETTRSWPRRINKDQGCSAIAGTVAMCWKVGRLAANRRIETPRR